MVLRDTPIASDGVITLTLHEESDVPALVEADRDPEHRRRFDVPPDFVPSPSHSRAVLARWARERDAGTRYPFAVRDANSGILLGGCELKPGRGGWANVSYWTHTRHRNQGIARRAVRLMTSVVARDMCLYQFEILTDPDNAASRAVARACGFLETGTRDGKLVHTATLPSSVDTRGDAEP